MKRWISRTQIAVGIVLAIVVIGCHTPVTPMLTDDDPEVQASAAASAGSSGPVGYLPGWSADDEDDLKELLESEKDRLDEAQERAKRPYDRLKRRWDRFLKRGYAQNDSPFLMCDPLQYTGETKIIGPEGGDMSIGPHKLSIPEGALSKYTVITGEMPVSTMVQVKLQGHGLRFARPVTLQLSYKHCYRPHDFSYRMVYIDGANNILEWPTSYDDKKEGEVTGWIEHFSRYAVATN